MFRFARISSLARKPYIKRDDAVIHKMISDNLYRIASVIIIYFDLLTSQKIVSHHTQFLSFTIINYATQSCWHSTSFVPHGGGKTLRWHPSNKMIHEHEEKLLILFHFDRFPLTKMQLIKYYVYYLSFVLLQININSQIFSSSCM